MTLIDGRAESGERNDSSGATEEGSGAGSPFSLTNSRDAQICAESGGMASNLPPVGENTTVFLGILILRRSVTANPAHSPRRS